MPHFLLLLQGFVSLRHLCISTGRQIEVKSQNPLLMMIQEKAARLQILSGWKDIATYLGKGVRTVQRHEREMGLPIHRPAGDLRGGQLSPYQAELDKWITAGPSRVVSMGKRRALDSR
jgi:hypothetical protein